MTVCGTKTRHGRTSDGHRRSRGVEDGGHAPHALASASGAPDRGVPVRAVEAMAHGLLWKQWPMVQSAEEPQASDRCSSHWVPIVTKKVLIPALLTMTAVLASCGGSDPTTATPVR